ncbi:hypothetical protein FOB64_005867 [Candida albicans]|uniref:WD repeat-containing protein JIP5 n=1 Tax=Candida albicans TaxID=5476 RepID=A0A8H6F103_CANAX|nr:hypothetical protein FOB64_005867 [Candida albicans]
MILYSSRISSTKPILLSGLATGHVYCNSYDAEKLEELTQSKREEYATLEKQAYTQGKIPHINKSVSQSKKKWWTIVQDNTEIPNDGDLIKLIGKQNVIRDHASTETGKVVGKVDVSSDYSNKKDLLTKLCHSVTHPFLLSGTEDGHVLVYDSANLNSNKLKFKVESAHDDSINHILAMPAVSAYHYLTLGSTTLAHIDIRKGIITQSDDQEDELLAMCFPSDEVSQSNDTVLVSHGEGLITIWKNSKNKLMDQLSRVKNNYKRGRVVETRLHSVAKGKHGAVDEVGILDIDFDYRLVSAGMDTLKIWSNTQDEEQNDEDDDDDNDDSDGDDSESVSGEDSWSDISSSDEELDTNPDDDSDKDDVDVEDDLQLRKKRDDISQLISKPKRKTIDINKLTKATKTHNQKMRRRSRSA